MGADLALRRAQGATRDRISAAWPAAAGALALAGVAATAMLAVVISSPDSPYGRWLGFLLQVTSVMPYVLIAGLAPAGWHVWRNRSKLARRLTAVMLLLVALASLLILVPIWALNESYEVAFEASFDDLATTSSSLSDKLITLEQTAIDDIAAEAIGELSTRGAGSSLAQGIVLDEFRERHRLDLIAHLGEGGRPRHVSPATAQVGGVSPFAFYLDDGEQGRTFRDVVVSEGGSVSLLHVEPFRVGGERETSWLLVRLTLPESVSGDITTVEESGTAYHKSRAQRRGLNEAFRLIVINAVALLLFVAINLAVYVGTRLGIRLGNLSDSMESVAGMPNPGTGVAVEGDDEITKVSASFNEMVARVEETMAKEKQALADLESIQSAIDAGLVVLDSGGRVVRRNPAAARLLGVPEVSAGETLADLVGRRPELKGLAELLEGGGPRASGETAVGDRKLWVRVATVGESRIALLTDISEPLALEEIRARQDAMSYTLHGIKNPLQPLLYHAESLDKLLGSLGEEDAAFLRTRREALLHNIGRINEQIEDMTRLVRKSDIRYQPLDVNSLVREFVAAQKGKKRCELALAGDLAPATFDRHELFDVLENLWSNAREQFGIDGTEEGKIRITTRMEDGRIVLAFEDNAGGIDPDRLEGIFRPHMSHKPRGQGIGLARAKSAVEDAGGSIEAANFEWPDGKSGARFTVRLRQAPLAEGRFS